MKITIESTSKVVTLNGVDARIWEGHTASGIPVHCFITRIGVARDQDTKQFESELEEMKAPSAEVASYSMRMIL